MSDKLDKPNVSRLTSFLACCFYGFVSTSITFFNKAVLSSYSFDSPNVMTLVQIICSLVFLAIMKRFNIITYSTINARTAIKTSPLSISFLGMVLTGLGALKYLNIPMFNALRRVTTLFTIAGESYLLNVHSSSSVRWSCYLMVVGAVVAALYDFDFSLIGYLLVGLNCLFTAAYLLSIAKFGKQGLNSFGLMYYNNIQSLPLVILLCWWNGDFAVFAGYPYLADVGFWVCFLFQSALAFLLNYSIFLCTNINSALATSVTGQIKNVLTTAVGYFSFGDVTYDPFNVIGLIIGVVASGWYSWLKYLESENTQKSPLLPTHIHNNQHTEEQQPQNRDEDHHHHPHSHGQGHHNHSH